MNQEIHVEPQGFSSTLLELIKQLDLDESQKESLLTITPRTVMVSPKPAMVILALNASQKLDKAAMEQLRDVVAKSMSDTDPPQLVLDVHYAQVTLNPQEYFTEHWQDLISVFSRQVNMAGAYLSLVRFSNGSDHKIRISLPNEMSLMALKRQDGDKIMGRLLSERLNRDISVRFELGEFGEEVKIREALYEKRIREELERIQAEESDEAQLASGTQGDQTKRSTWRVVYGRKIASPPVPIASIKEEEPQVIFEGELITFECKTLRTGRQLILMDVYDKTGSMNTRLFIDAGKELAPEIKAGAYVRLRGAVQYDKYSQDLCLFVKDILIGKKEERKDEAEVKRVELHAHTQMSAMDAMVGVTQLVKRAADFGHKAIAITDHGVVQAFPEAMSAGEKYGIKVLYGMEGYLIEDEWLETVGKRKPPRPYHISILISEPQGVRNLYKMVSHAHLNYFHRHPRLPRSVIFDNRDGLLLGSACEQGEVFRKLMEGAPQSELEAVASKYDYLEIMPRGNNAFLVRNGKVEDEAGLLELNRKIYQLGQKLEIPVVATGDVHFLEPGDEVFRSILQSGMGFDDATLQAPLFFKSTNEMLEEFDYLGKAEAYEVVVENPDFIAEKVKDVKPLKLDFYPPKLPNAEKELKTFAFEQAKERYGDPMPEVVVKRLEREIKAINDNHFASLFLIAQKLVQRSIRDGYLVGSRGSVGSSFTATMLGITEVNPLPGYYLCSKCRHFEPGKENTIGADLDEKECPLCGTVMEKDGFDIPFEVFMGFKGNKLPDIDLNFSGEYQSVAHKSLEEIFDKDHIFRAGTISTVADRIAYGFVKKYLEENELVIREAEVNRLTRGCAGVKKTTGQHPGGIMIVPADMEIYDFTPVQRPADDRKSEITTTHLDYHAIHDALLKLDILGHDDPTSLKRLGDLTGVDVRSIPLDDPDTLKIFSSLDSLGVTKEQLGTSIGSLGIPEFGTEFVRQMLDATKPTAFSELVRISGLSHGTDVWLNNAADLIKEKTATLSTVISARDDIMNYLISKGVEPALSFQIMECVRKGKGVKPDQETIMKANGVPKWYIESCKKIKYMFPKAHAVAYCVMAFRIAYFKVHFPAAFYANYFSLNAEFFDAELVVHGGQKKVLETIKTIKAQETMTAKEKNNLTVLEVVREAFARGIQFQAVSLSESDPQVFQLRAQQVLLPPLISLAGLGLTCALRIAEERGLRTFRSIEELGKRTGANKNVVEIMTQHGCLDILPKTDQTTLF